MRHIPQRVLLTVIVLFGLIGLAPDAPNATWQTRVAYADKIDGEVWQALDASADGKTPIIIQLGEQTDLTEAARIQNWQARGRAVVKALQATATRSQLPIVSKLQNAQAKGRAAEIRPLWIVNAIAVRADETTIKMLADFAGVTQIVPNLKLETPQFVQEKAAATPTGIEWGVAKIGAPDVWATYGITGTGSVVANVDTGVEFSHPALVNQYRGNLGNGNFNHNYNWFDPKGIFPAPAAIFGSHGTHVMGTEVGWDGGNNRIGVAPGAKWIAAYGCCPDNATLLEAQQFMLAPTDLAGNDPNPDLRPDVLNQSWGGPGGSEIFQSALSALHASGVFLSISAGNSGSDCATLGSPGDNPYVFTVGSTNSSDNISGSSSRGPNPFSGKTGPEVSAPGELVRSSVAGGGYQFFSGTSMAAPHVAGAVALLISLEPKLRGRVDELEELIRKTAAPRTSAQTCGGVSGSAVPNNTFGWGRLDVKAAADLMWQAGIISGTVTLNGVPLANATVQYSRLGKQLLTKTDENGRYNVVAGAGTWNMSISRGTFTVSAPDVFVTNNATTTQNFDLTAPNTAILEGRVTDATTGIGIAAMVMDAEHEEMPPIFANSTGFYRMVVPVNSNNTPVSYKILVQHPGFQTQTKTVELTGNQTANFVLTARSNYLCADSREPGGPRFDWIDASSGTAYRMSDDSSTVVTLPKPFTYFGVMYKSITVNSNGYAALGETWNSGTQMILPFEGRPNNEMMALGEDLNPASGTQGMVYTKSMGNKFVIQWQDVQHWASGNPETFQIILDLVTGEIKYQYQTLSWPDFTTVGLENADGSAGKLYSYANSAQLTNARAVQFVPASGNNVAWECDHAYALTTTKNVSGTLTTYRIHWNLVGFGGAPAAVLTATLPAGATFIDASNEILPQNGVLTWQLGNLRPKTSGTTWFTVQNAAQNAHVETEISDNHSMRARKIRWLPLLQR